MDSDPLNDPSPDAASSSSGDGAAPADATAPAGDSGSATKDFCYGDITMLNDPSGDDPNPVARGHNDSTQQNTLDNDPPVGAVFVDFTNVSPSEAKRSDGADWAGSGAQSGSDAANATSGAGPGAAAGAALGAAVGSGSAAA